MSIGNVLPPRGGDDNYVRPTGAPPAKISSAPPSSMPPSIDYDPDDPVQAALYAATIKAMEDLPVEEKDIMFRIMALISQLTTTMQELAKSQALYLTKLTELSSGYVKLQSQVPIYVIGGGFRNIDGTPDNNPGSGGSQQRDLRNDINAIFGAAGDAVRAHKGQRDDEAKKVQATLQTFKDAGTGFTDLLSSLLDQLKACTQALLR